MVDAGLPGCKTFEKVCKLTFSVNYELIIHNAHHTRVNL